MVLCTDNSPQNDQDKNHHGNVSEVYTQWSRHDFSAGHVQSYWICPQMFFCRTVPAAGTSSLLTPPRLASRVTLSC